MFPNPFRHLTCKAIFNHWIYFFPTPSTILHLSKCFEVRAKPKLIPGVQGNPERLFRSRIWARKQNCPLGPAAKFSCSLLRGVQISYPTHWANGLKGETSEWVCPARMTPQLCVVLFFFFLFFSGSLASEGAWDRFPRPRRWSLLSLSRILSPPCSEV